MDTTKNNENAEWENEGVWETVLVAAVVSLGNSLAKTGTNNWPPFATTSSDFFAFFLFAFLKCFFLSNTVVNKWPLFVTTSSQLSTQLLQAINSLDSCYGLSTALTAVSSRLERVACQGSYGSCCKLSTHFTVVGSFDSWNKLSSVLASCFNLLTAIAPVTSCQ